MSNRDRHDVINFPVGILEGENLRTGSIFFWQEEALGPTYECEIIFQGRNDSGYYESRAKILDVHAKFPGDD